MRKFYLDQLYPEQFQELTSALLLKRFGEALRCTPLRGADGGRDAETPRGHPIYGYVSDQTQSPEPISETPAPGRYLFQVKHHSAYIDEASNLRQAVVADFRAELEANVLSRSAGDEVNYFFLITNVASSAKALESIDKIRVEHSARLSALNLHADVWWYEQVVALLHAYPNVWSSFPSIFPGSVVPIAGLLGGGHEGASNRIPQALRLSIKRDFKNDQQLRFQQLELQSEIDDLFVDLNVDGGLPEGASTGYGRGRTGIRHPLDATSEIQTQEPPSRLFIEGDDAQRVEALEVLLGEDSEDRYARVLLQGGPGQGKSTITQMLAQVHRAAIIDERLPRGSYYRPRYPRIPFRVELRLLSEWLSSECRSLEEYLCDQIQSAAGGRALTIDELQNIFYTSPTLIIFDGLDEIGSGDLRKAILSEIEYALDRLSDGDESDLQVVMTTRPPAAVGYEDKLASFRSCTLLPMGMEKIEEYVSRWIGVHSLDENDAYKLRRAFFARAGESHVRALATNPMQLAILLHFIRLKGEAFPSRRAQLYHDYFHHVIDRDVQKTPQLASRRTMIERLHEFVAYRIHALTEAGEYDGSLPYARLKTEVRRWLISQDEDPEEVSQLIRVGEERLCLIVAKKGEGENTSYGFDVQPVREYFSAAYVKNQATGKAHDCLVAMFRRSFWWEVALFLSGLALPNEKADIIQRCIEIDQNAEHEWKQIGRKAILQLVEEGVLDEPAATYNSAMEFLIGSFHSGEPKKRALDRDFFLSIRDLLKDRMTERLNRRVHSVCESGKDSSDDSQKIRLAWLRYGVLPCAESVGLASDDNCDNQLSYAIANIYQPVAAGCDPFASEKWRRVGQRIEERYLVEVFVQIGLCVARRNRPQVPEGIHYRLIASLMTAPGVMPLRFRRSPGCEVETLSGEDAAWALVDVLASGATFATPIGMSLLKGECLYSVGVSAPIHKEVRWKGVDDHTVETLKPLVDRFYEVVREISEGSDDDEVRAHFVRLASRAESASRESGIVGYVGARFSAFIVFMAAQYHTKSGSGFSIMTENTVRHLIEQNAEFESIPDSLIRYYATSEGVEITDDDGESDDNIERIWGNYAPIAPINIRSTVVGRWRAIEEEVRDAVQGSEVLSKGDEWWFIQLDSDRAISLLWCKGGVSEPPKSILEFVGSKDLDGEPFVEDEGAEISEEVHARVESLVRVLSDDESTLLQRSGCYAGITALGAAQLCDAEVLIEGLWARWECVRSIGPELFRTGFGVSTAETSTRSKYLKTVARYLLSDSRPWPAVVLESASQIAISDTAEIMEPLASIEDQFGLNLVAR